MSSASSREALLKFTFRHCRPSDFETLYRIDRACYEPGIAYSRRTLRAFLTIRESRCWVACLEREIIGFLIAYCEAPVGHLITIDILESARRRGAGSALLAIAEREMASSGITVVELETATNNHPAIAFWNKRGYQVDGIHPRYYMGRIDAYLMSKRLDDSSIAL
jgi:ribosomal protein S18 acetylase RimI-like enzyme